MSETEEIKRAVKRAYGSLADSRTIPLDDGCCEPATKDKLLGYGYTAKELGSLPESVIAMSDGCGNPTGLGMIREGETVLDLGSGGGIDVFLASGKVGHGGKVIGLDMTPEMVQKARANAQRAGLANVEFRLGEMESLPLGDASVDVIISNCVICLSPDKGRVFREMFRVLRPGGEACHCRRGGAEAVHGGREGGFDEVVQLRDRCDNGRRVLVSAQGRGFRGCLREAATKAWRAEPCCVQRVRERDQAVKRRDSWT